MKKIGIIFVMILISSFTVFAQTAVELYGGVNFANLTTPDNLADGATWTTNAGSIGGFGFSFLLTETIICNPGIRFI
ncbi:MAG: hypothetical protein WCT99_10890 [Bacteroidota bacterium]